MRLTTFIAGHILMTSAAAAAAVAPRFETCNGRSELCSRRYSNITFVGAHNSPFHGDTLSDNQNIPLPEQLSLGVRFLQGQTHNDGIFGTIRLCHSECLLRDAGTLAEGMLAPVKTFLDANPTEVVTLLLTNPDGFDGNAFGNVFREVGLESYAFVPSGNEWPTLDEMIASGKRLVVFTGLWPAPVPMQKLV